MFFGPTHKEYFDAKKALEEWHDHYAILPVRLEDGRFAWLEKIQRKLGAYGVWKYRAKE